MLQRLAVREVPAMLERLRSQGLQPVLLDVREPWERALASVSSAHASSVAIPMREIPARLAELDATQPILALCHHGMRSLQVVAFLLQQGYPHVYNIEGGIDAWSHEVDPTVPRY
jgi:rhodanese-related sulfurtransferase